MILKKQIKYRYGKYAIGYLSEINRMETPLTKKKSARPSQKDRFYIYKIYPFWFGPMQKAFSKRPLGQNELAASGRPAALLAHIFN